MRKETNVFAHSVWITLLSEFCFDSFSSSCTHTFSDFRDTILLLNNTVYKAYMVKVEHVRNRLGGGETL